MEIVTTRCIENPYAYDQYFSAFIHVRLNEIDVYCAGILCSYDNGMTYGNGG